MSSDGGSPERKSIHRKSKVNGPGFGRQRRITPINPNIKITEITRLVKSEESERKKIVIPNRSEIYHFVCEGDMDDDKKKDFVETDSKKRHIKWSASFDKPIEELIYPSLQRFDNKQYEERRKMYEKLHGHRLYENSSMSSLPNGSNSKAAPNNNTANIKLDLLPEAQNLRSDMMFLHTPKWSVEITYPAAELAQSPDPTASQSPEASDKKSSLKSKRAKMKRFNSVSGAQSGYNKAFRDSSFSVDDSTVSGAVEEDDEEEDGNYFKIMSEKEYKKYKSKNPLEDIDVEGEKYLRRQIKTNYEKKLEEDALDEQLRLKSLSPFNISIRRPVSTTSSKKAAELGDGGEQVVSSSDDCAVDCY